jgi:hypothetical protein
LISFSVGRELPFSVIFRDSPACFSVDRILFKSAVQSSRIFCA